MIDRCCPPCIAAAAKVKARRSTPRKPRTNWKNKYKNERKKKFLVGAVIAAISAILMAWYQDDTVIVGTECPPPSTVSIDTTTFIASVRLAPVESTVPPLVEFEQTVG